MGYEISSTTELAHDGPSDRPAVAHERNGVTITSFPVIHLVNGSVGHRLDYGPLAVGHETVPAVRTRMRTRHDGPVVISHDRTPFDTTLAAIVGQQGLLDPHAHSHAR
jgi:ribonuclease Z